MPHNSMSKLSEFFQRAVKAQTEMAGTVLSVTRPKSGETWSLMGVMTARDGSMTAEAGGVIVSITGHALIPKGGTYTPQAGDRVESGGQNFLIVSAISSPDDGAFSCDLVAVQK